LKVAIAAALNVKVIDKIYVLEKMMPRRSRENIRLSLIAGVSEGATRRPSFWVQYPAFAAKRG